MHKAAGLVSVCGFLIILCPEVVLAQQGAASEGCKDPFLLDVQRGALSNVLPDATPDQVKRLFPCFTGETQDGSRLNYGGGVFYNNHKMFFYTGRNFIAVRKGFVGTVKPPLLEKGKMVLDSTFGKPVKSLRSQRRGPSNEHYLYDRSYGCLAAKTESGLIVEVVVSTSSCIELYIDLELDIAEELEKERK